MDEEAKQIAFEPPLLALGVKADSGAFQHLKGNSAFARSILGTGQKDIAFAFFQPTEQEGDKLSGYRFEAQETGAPIRVDAPAWVEAKVTR